MAGNSVQAFLWYVNSAATTKTHVIEILERGLTLVGTPSVQIEVIGDHNGSASIRRTNKSDNGTTDEKKGDVPA